MVYYLPMDAYQNGTLKNPSGLYVNVFGGPKFTRGVLNRALVIRGHQWIRVAGPAHRQECFGDLDLCPEGYTISFWLKFLYPSYKKQVFLTNGGDRSDSHGIAMLYSKGVLEFIFRDKSGNEWRASDKNVLPGQWFMTVHELKQLGPIYHYHLDMDAKRGKSLDVAHMDASIYGNVWLSHDAVIGRSLQLSGPEQYVSLQHQDRDTLLYLDFIQRGKPHFDYFTFDQMIGNRIIHPSIMIETYGNPKLVSGKIGNAIQLDGKNEYVDMNEHPGKCLGDLDACPHGLLMTTWMRLDHLKDNMAFFSTALNGITMEFTGGKLVFSLATSSKMWTAKMDPRRLSPGKWQFLEISWHPQHGLKIYVNENLIASDLTNGETAVKSQNFRFQHSQDRFYLGKGKDTGNKLVFGAVTFDNIRYWYGDRDYLLAHGYLQRGRPINYLIDMEKISGKRLIDDSLYITVNGDPQLIPGRIFTAPSELPWPLACFSD
ncbi:unnamed protein product [Acanthosepion pharaonis]|uniref:Uncharacterized protein n=1 Tax=Acanthosepion pharaonis TaxID=158019 RepID=A0A812DUL1_ACAPH|nr:unnamed protein product [Sepia pharaonis]